MGVSSILITFARMPAPLIVLSMSFTMMPVCAAAIGDKPSEETKTCAFALTAQHVSLGRLLSRGRFHDDRDLRDYWLTLRDLNGALGELSPGSILIDVGPGRAIADQQILHRFSNVSQVFAIDYLSQGARYEETLHQATNGKLKYLTGKYIEELYVNGELASLIGKTGLILDVYAAATYSPHLDQILEIYLELLKTGGRLEFVFPLKTERKHTVFRASDGRKISLKEQMNIVSDWLGRIKGAKILGIGREEFVATSTMEISLQRTSGEVHVPGLILESFSIGTTPPVRVYRSRD